MATLLPLLLELNDLKRIRVAGQSGSLATALFRRAWARLVAGEPLAAVAESETAHAVAAVRLAGISGAVLRQGGLPPALVQAIRARGFAASAGAIAPALQERLSPHIHADMQDIALETLPPFVGLLCEQPRAGATRPGRQRVALEPAELHSEHCGVVAVAAVLCAPLYGAELALPFLCGLAHHLHNAYLPDAGYAGDELLGEALPTLVETFRTRALNELPKPLPGPVRAALALVYQADTAEARAFQAADVLDRVIEMRWHAQAASFTLDVALGDMDIVHPGPVQAFQSRLLRQTGIL